MNQQKNLPIGVFDSGVGGLTVAREIMRQMPNERIVYFGDTARVPYGSKSRETITRYREGKLISAADFTAEEKTDQIITALERDNIIPICNEAILQYAEEDAALESDEVTELRSTIEVITLAGKKEKRGGTGYILKNAQELQAAKPKIVDILFKATKFITNFN